jgi:hypothetical protein
LKWLFGQKRKGFINEGQKKFLSILIKQKHEVHNLCQKINGKRGTTSDEY